ncbi:MAG: AAA family ATPase [Deltaproteobacteria bacterium]|nr:AAA family ATPase [Deltaproteobacteria bacterium]
MSQLHPAAIERIARLRRALGLELREVRQRDGDRLAGRSPRALEASGVLARRLVLLEESPALMGRTRWVLGEDASRPGHLTAFSGRPGAMVTARGAIDDGRELPRGVIARVQRGRVVVFFDEPPELEEDAPLDLILSSDEVTLPRLFDALDAAEKSEGRARALVEILLGAREPRAISDRSITPHDATLNEDQLEAARLAAMAEDLALVHGPFGTGKTTVLVEVVRQARARGERVLCLAASNAAVDHLALEILAREPELKLTRVGHPARAHPLLEPHTLAGRLESSDRRRIARDLLDQAFRALRLAQKRTRAADGAARRRVAREEARALFAEARRLERQAAAEILEQSPVVAGTLTGFQQDLPRDISFDLAVIDEASQALTPAVLLGALHARRMVLAGDHLQLPPTVLSPVAASEGLAATVFEALIRGAAGERIAHLLTVQHRMHADLMRFSSDRFYEGRLRAHPQVATRTLADLGVADDPLTLATRPLDVIDTAGAGFEERQGASGSSRENPEQADLVARVVRALISNGLTPDVIGVITPYAAQVALLLERLSEYTARGLEIDTVDGFQGREKEAIIFDAVRSNAGGEVGFLSDQRRLNVALTRAKRKLVIVADSSTLSHDDTWAALFDAAAIMDAHRSCFLLGAMHDG